MISLIALIIIIVICLGYLVYFLIKKLPDVKSLDIETIPQEKKSEAKTKIIEAKLFRDSKRAKAKIDNWLVPYKNYSTSLNKKIQELVVSIENKYKPKPKVEPVFKTTGELFAEAQELLNKEEFATAEKKLIEVIAKNKKDKHAYELLGEIYFKTKAYDQAEEVYKYLIKLHIFGERKAGKKFLKTEELAEAEEAMLSNLEVDKKLAVYYNDLANIYELRDKHDKALDSYLKALAVEPNNPKYLDSVTKLSIKLGDSGLAKKTYRRLKKINPENAKLMELEAAIEKMK